MAEAVEAAPSANLDWALPTETCIRLLKITGVIPATEETKEDTIFYSVHTFELGECPPFLAISYTWSSPVRPDIHSTESTSPEGDQTVKTFVANFAQDAETQEWLKDEEGKLDVRGHKTTRNGTKNLRDALVQLYRLGLGAYYIWADAVCIDQDDEQEKGSQVAMMGDIYAAALAVVVWLGPVDGDPCFECWRWIHTEFCNALESWFATHSVEELKEQQPLDPKFTSELGITPPGGSWMECWEKYFSFYRRRTWFSRAWVVQEAALARQVMVQCGPESLSWASLVTVGGLLLNLGWQLTLAPTISRGFGRAMADEIIRLQLVESNFKERRARVDALLQESGTAESTQGPTQAAAADHRLELANKGWFAYLESLLVETRVYHASDPRDKIYSILGLAKRGLVPGMAMPITPDYAETSTACSLFTSVAVMLLKERPRLQLLSFVQDKANTRLEGLPSWVPDWTNPLNGSYMPLLRGPDHFFDCYPCDIEPGALFRLSGNDLILQGAEFDVITATCRPMWDIIRTQDIGDLLEICQELSPEYADPGEALWRTIVANTFNGEPAPPALAEPFKAWASVRLAVLMVPDVVQRDPSDDNARVILPDLDVTGLRERLAPLTRLRAQTKTGDHSGQLIRDADAGADAVTPSPTDHLPTEDEVLNMCRLIYRFKLYNIISEHSSLSPEDPLPTIEEQMTRVEGRATGFHNAMGPTIPFRRLYRTSGGYLGLGPASATVGDRVWLLRGARVPYVLRERAGESGAFELLGATYVHGFMHGEMAARVGDVREIVLR